MITILLAAIVAGSAFAQNRQITGTVKDSNGEPIVGATVMVPKSTLGTSTDLDGRFLISVPDGTSIIEVSSIGYASSTVTLGTASNYEVVLRDGSIEFIQHGNGNWNFAVSHVQAVPGQIYHVFGVWDKETIKCYVDGELKATVGVTTLKHKSGLHCMGVAGNYNSETKFNGSWNGTIVVARLYDNPLTAEQIKAKTALKGKIQIVK